MMNIISCTYLPYILSASVSNLSKYFAVFNLIVFSYYWVLTIIYIFWLQVFIRCRTPTKMPTSQSPEPINILPSMAKRTLLMWLSLRTLRWGAYPGLSGGPPGTVSSNLFSGFFSQIWLVSSHAFMPSLGFFSALFSLLWFSVFWTITILIYLDSKLHLLNTVCQAPHRFALPDPQPGISHKSVNGGKHKAHLFIF